jgi:hypothetical protein
LDQGPGAGRTIVGRVQSLDSEPELFQLRDRGSPTAELAWTKRTQIRMLMSVRSRDNRLRVISALLVQKYYIARREESIAIEELIASDLVELGNRGEYGVGIC